MRFVRIGCAADVGVGNRARPYAIAHRKGADQIAVIALALLHIGTRILLCRAVNHHLADNQAQQLREPFGLSRRQNTGMEPAVTSDRSRIQTSLSCPWGGSNTPDTSGNKEYSARDKRRNFRRG